LSAAAGAVQMGASTVLIEAGEMGGDCLNTGCVPSKALLAAAHAAHAARAAERFGVLAAPVRVDYRAVREHVRRAIAAIAPNDSQQRFEKLGCRVIREHARFSSPTSVEAGDAHIRARRFVIATGSRPAVPPIDGLDETPFLTNESVFDLEELPPRLVVIGAGPVGCELAQAFRRLGTAVTVIDAGPILPNDDSEAAAVVRQALSDDGVTLIENTAIERIRSDEEGLHVLTADGKAVSGSQLLVACGRRPNIEELGLHAAKIEHDAQGIKVDRRLRTSNRKAFAIGDVAGGPQFTHLAGYHAGIVLRNALFRLPAAVDLRALPWVTYTDPELAQVGLTEAQARAIHGEGVRISRASFEDNDRALTEGDVRGFIKVVLDRKGRLLGATIVGSQAGELIHGWGLGLSAGIKLGKIASTIAAYPTRAEIGKRAAGNYFAPMLFGPRVQRLVRILARLG
jgi:pyruvate/2-oxoglutarate dehydrogenase complex dihydrolipoamide dehydrogenase (E3) component